MIESTMNGQEILEEIEHVASTEEIRDYAIMIGINPDTEPELMYLAMEGIDAPLPEDWKACRNEISELYYFNFATGTSLWDHPMDQHYKDLVIEERQNRRNGKLLKDLSENDNFSNLPNTQLFTLHHFDKDELQIIPDSKTKQFYQAESNESDSQSSECNLSTESKSEDYGHGIDFGLDKSITDRLNSNEPYIHTFGSSFNKSNTTQLSNTNTSLLKSNDILDKPIQPILSMCEKVESSSRVSDEESKINTITISDKMSDSDSKIDLIEEIHEEIKYNGELERMKEDVKQKIAKEIEIFEQREYEKMRNSCEDRLNREKQMLESKLELGRQELLNEYLDKTERHKREMEMAYQKNIKEITQQYNSAQIEMLEDNHKKAVKESAIKLKYKLDDLNIKNNQELAMLKAEFQNKMDHIHTEQERVLLSNQSELKHLKVQHKAMLDKMEREKKSIQAQMNEYEAQRQAIMQNQSELLSNSDKTSNTPSNREIRYAESLNKLKVEFNDVKTHLIESRSELASLKHEIFVLNTEKQKITQLVEFETEQLAASASKRMKNKESYDSAVLVDDVIVSHSFETPIINRSTIKLNSSSQSKQQLTDKSKYITSLQPLTQNFLVKSKSISLPSLHNLDSSIYFQKSRFTHEPTNSQHKFTSSVITTDYVDSLQKITSDLNHIVESLKTDRMIQSSTKSISLFANNNSSKNTDISLTSNLCRTSQNDFEKTLQTKYDKVFNRTNNCASGSSSNSISAMSKDTKITSSKYFEFNSKSSTEDRLKKHKNWLTNFKLESSLADI